jgi:hypothetical protein
MRLRWTLSAFLLTAALGAAQDPKPQDVTLTCKPSPPKEKQPHLSLSGTANFPDGIVLKMGLLLEFESCAGSRLVPVMQDAGRSLVEVKGKKIQHIATVSSLGSYSIAITFPDEFQKPSIMESLKGKITTRTWQFNFLAWGDDLIGRLGPKLAELDVIARECVDMATRIEKLAGSEGSWIKDRKNVDARGADLVLTKEAEEVLKETAKLVTRLDRSDLRMYFPAAYNEIYYTIRTTSGNAQHFTYEKGQFAGAKNYHSGVDKMKTHRGDDFSFENVKKYLEEASPIAGRELALWIVKDLKRTEGQMRGDLQDALKTYGPHPGLSPFADRLMTATVADLKALEEDIRTAHNDTAKEKDKDKPAAGDWECPVCKKKNRAADAACKATADCKGKKP